MKTKKERVMAAFVGAALSLSLCSTARAAQVNITDTDTDKKADSGMEIFGSVRVSVDYQDSDVSGADAKSSPLLSDGGVSISSNTTRIGFRGRQRLGEGYTALWQYEQQVDLDDNDPGDVWTTADSFLGVDSPFGTFLLGRVNTPFKNLGVDYMAYFNTTVGDPHAILGAQSRPGGRIDLRAGNSLTWRNSFGGLDMAAQYSADERGSHGTVDNNDNDSYSASIKWNPKPLEAGAAYVHFSNVLGIGDLSAYRGFLRYWMGPLVVGAVYENMDSDDTPRANRAAYGTQIYYYLSKATVVGGQWNHAEASDVGDDAADQYSLGVFHYFNKRLLVHAVYSETRNDNNASFRGVDYAHNDYLGTLPGHNPRAFSVGADLRF